MCKSVPQMPVFWTRIRTSLMPVLGTGTSSSQRPGFECALTRAFIAFMRLAKMDTVLQYPGDNVRYTKRSLSLGQELPRAHTLAAEPGEGRGDVRSAASARRGIGQRAALRVDARVPHGTEGPRARGIRR